MTTIAAAIAGCAILGFFAVMSAVALLSGAVVLAKLTWEVSKWLHHRFGFDTTEDEAARYPTD